MSLADGQTFLLKELRSVLFFVYLTYEEEHSKMYLLIKAELDLGLKKHAKVDDLRKALESIYKDDLPKANTVLFKIVERISYERNATHSCCGCNKDISIKKRYCDAECEFHSQALYPY